MKRVQGDEEIKMAYEEYIALSEKVISLPYSQRLDLLSRIADSLNEEDYAPENITVNSKEDLHKKLQEGLDDLNCGRTVSEEEAKNLFKIQ